MENQRLAESKAASKAHSSHVVSHVLDKFEPTSRVAMLQQVLGNQATQQQAAKCPAFSICPTGGACHQCPFRVLTKLTVSQPGDSYEQEADRVADQVMRAAEPIPRHQVDDDVEETQWKPLVRRRVADDDGGRDVSTIVHEVLRLPGQPLDLSMRAYFEPMFGHDFSRVRVHTDARAAESARRVNALAYAVGRNVVFGAEQYAPQTIAGRRLIAHELTHVVQQDAVSKLHAGQDQQEGQYAQKTKLARDNVSEDRTAHVAKETTPLRISRQEGPSPLWGGFRIIGDSAFIERVRADLNRLNATRQGSALLHELTEYTRPWYRSLNRIKQSSSCGFIPDTVYYNDAGCGVRDTCRGASPGWASAANYIYLFHELVHSYISISGKGTHPDRECMTTGLGPYFVSVRYNENRLRCELGLPVRPCYDQECPLPAPDCSVRR